MKWTGGIAVGAATLLALPAAAVGHLTRQDVALTAFGATRKAWAANHRADPNTKLIRGCCFLPRQNDGRDRYYALMFDRGRVFGYEMAFGPRVSASLARTLMRKEVPPDARLVGRKRKATCEQLVYRSATLKRIFGHADVGVEFSASGVGGRYRGVVGDVLIGSYIALDIDC